MHFPAIHPPSPRRGRRAACVLSCVLAGCTSPAYAALNSILKDSPFIPENYHEQPPVAPVTHLPSAPLSLELHGFSIMGNDYLFSLYDVRTQTSFWLHPNDPSHADIVVNSFNPVNSTLNLTANGREMELTLKEPSSQPMAELPATPPLVVYSPFDTGDHSRSAPGVAIPAPAASPVAAPAPNAAAQLQLRGQNNPAGRGNPAGQTGRGTGRGGFASNPAASGGSTAASNPAANFGTGFGSGGTATPRRQIQQPTG